MASSIRIARLKGEAEAAVKSMKLIATKADEEDRKLLLYMAQKMANR